MLLGPAAQRVHGVVAFVGVVAVIVMMAGQATAASGSPSEQLRVQIDRVIHVVSDPSLKTEARNNERRAEIRKVANEIFDFRETTQRSLARHWQQRTPAERDEFVAAFTDVLERAYIGRIEEYSDEKVLFLGETIEDNQATVRTRIVTKQGVETPVDYRMLRRGDRWLTYDVSIEGISLVGNYRAQFNQIIQKSSYAELVKQLKNKAQGTEDTNIRRASQKR
jgi:phospholipid transport system substrate-binding protein